ncbi:hypothetical protein FA95DRAFT_1585574 [Auriscalpium vulgare]|uniref:Uncharacterized protein n=1 Tax=Auriscalpium vulgare TaxID=40419 RepID=A0ACB8R143_9AGAM|nr:hypothetical protein FA95DRAFT_1585574 [Auriscalpium vulgare]
MVDCGDLYHISAQMSQALQSDDQAFGGKNMIFAGDFAQLPPIQTKGPALYSHNVSTVLGTTNGFREQQRTIGKALWHQATVVVILRQNMRQRSQTERDAQFRTALENMRYKSCTAQDIALLRSRIKGPQNPDVDPNHPNFRFVSVITAFNSQRDQINTTMSERFAQETNQVLKPFYSVDKWKAREPTSARPKGRQLDPKRKSNNVPPDMQAKLHSLPHGATMHIPGVLKLCHGLPVMIKRNEATEVCVTNGAEGTVVGWQSHALDDRREALDVVFVKLTKPPTNVQLKDLPENVVPLAQQSTPIKCNTPNDGNIFISREQVPIVPNFAMTDYASQGRTRPFNIVDPFKCRSHYSMYTCLSRSASLDGTILMRDFSTAIITGGLPGHVNFPATSMLQHAAP